jgi:penicillin-binding protein 1C
VKTAEKKKPSLRTRIKRWAGILAAGPVLAVLGFGLLSWVFPFPKDRLIEAQSTESALVLDQKGGIIAWRVNQMDNWQLPVSLDHISPWVIKATMATEDKRFRSHGGIDPLALVRAVGQNLNHRRRISGASTLTMQSIRLLWPRNRTYPAKCVEAFRALQLERLATKDQIMQLYLNLAPYGGNVVGIEAAAMRYFDKRVCDLTLGEAALLAGLPQNPAWFNPDKHLDKALARREYVMTQMRNLGLATNEEIQAAMREPIRIYRTPGTDIPGFSDYVLKVRQGQGGIIQTTLNPEIQTTVSQALARRARDHLQMGIDGTAVVVIDVPSGSLAAMIGSITPRDHQTGLVNAALTKRQPGSLLKPFIYAAAFDLGMLTPDSIVYDTPSAWGQYRPRNMDRDFLGPIPAARALILSRNIPAVRLLDQIGTKRLAGDIKQLGFKVQGAEERCGLSLALGTAEVSLVDIANAYAALARLGRYKSLRVFSEEKETRETQVFSAGASYLLLRALGAARPDQAAQLVWKTGTSWQYRDAWAVAMTPKHVVAVWCGKLCGKGHSALVGLRTAQPLALEIAHEISSNRISSWPCPSAVRTRTVCSLSGSPAAAACPQTLEAEYLPGTSTEVPCTLHSFQGTGNDRRVAITWPKNVAGFLSGKSEDQAEPIRSLLAIHSPADGGEYFLKDAGDHLDFCIEQDKTPKKIFWFLNHELAAVSSAQEPFPWPMTPGKYELIASDEQGRSARISFKVSSIFTR